MAPKRSVDEIDDQRPSKRQVQDHPVAPAYQSLRQQAEPYRLATAIIPFAALTCRWQKGQNRALQRQHASNLRDDFKKLGLAREAEENFMFVQSDRVSVDQMLDHLQIPERLRKDGIHDFHDWLEVNPGIKIEVAAGQHRMEALELYYNGMEGTEKELWWTCIIYDEGKLPPGLCRQLRMNRKRSSQPDSAGDMWMQLVEENDCNESLFQGTKAEVQDNIRKALQLGSKDTFPVGRVVTLWRNNRWRAMLTRWYTTQLGRETLQNISSCEWMASLQIDNYWFSALDDALAALRGLHPTATDKVTKADWKELQKTLKDGNYDKETVESLFYPSKGKSQARLEDKKRQIGGAGRRVSFLSGYDDEEYHRIYQRLCQRNKLKFSDIEDRIGIKKEDGQILKQVMRHAIRWVNPSVDSTLNSQENNKPLLRRSFVPALLRKYNENDFESERDKQADTESQELERKVLDIVRDHLGFFKSPATKACLEYFYQDGNDVRYLRRFTEAPWRMIIDCIEDSLGGAFEPPWDTLLYSNIGRQMSNRTKAKSITRSIVMLMKNIPDIVDDPALSSCQAFEELQASIDRVVEGWVLQQCGGTGAAEAEDEARQTVKQKENDNIDSLPLRRRSGSRAVSSDAPTPWSPINSRDSDGHTSDEDEIEILGKPSSSQRDQSGIHKNNKDRTQDAEDQSQSSRVHVAPRKTIPMSPAPTPVSADNRRSHKTSRPSTTFQAAGLEKLRKPRKRVVEKLPSISSMLADMGCTNRYQTR